MAALVEQQAQLSDLIDGLSPDGWAAATRCEGWDVSDVILHLAQTNELAVGSLAGRFAEALVDLLPAEGATTSVDDTVDRMVQAERSLSPSELQERWSSGAARLVSAFREIDPSTRVVWVAGRLSARTLATTRLAETWIHTGDVADAVGVTLATGERLRLIARLAWRTLPYAFASAGRTMSGPVAFRLLSPSGDTWDLTPPDPAATTITGTAAELCAVAARRVDPSATSLRGDGPDAADVLALVRTYA